METLVEINFYTSFSVRDLEKILSKENSPLSFSGHINEIYFENQIFDAGFEKRQTQPSYSTNPEHLIFNRPNGQEYSIIPGNEDGFEDNEVRNKALELAGIEPKSCLYAEYDFSRFRLPTSFNLRTKNDVEEISRYFEISSIPYVAIYYGEKDIVVSTNTSKKLDDYTF